MTGVANFDSLSLKQVDDHTVKSTQKKGGKEVVRPLAPFPRMARCSR